MERYGIRGVSLQFFILQIDSNVCTDGKYSVIRTNSDMRNSTREGFLIYINNLPNCSNALTFRVYADDTNVFASANDLKVLEKIVNSELKNSENMV